jgi:hypothetical protein
VESLEKFAADLIGGWKRRRAKRRQAALDEAGSNTVCELLAHCPVCKRKAAGHHYAYLASTPYLAENQRQIDALFSAFKEHRWQEALSFNEFDPVENDVTVIALRCTNGQVTVVIQYDPCDFGDVRELMHYEALNVNESNKLNVFIDTDEWRPLTWTYPS